MLQTVVTWCVQNKVAVVALCGCASHAATILNQTIPPTKGPKWLHAALGRLGTLDKDGNFSVPIFQGNKPEPAAAK